MSNYCGTDYYFDGEKSCLLDFYSRLKRIAEDESIDNYRERKWMTHVAEAFGLKSEEYYCCGFFNNLHFNAEKGWLTFFVESANKPCEDLIDAITKHYGEKIRALWFVSCDDDGEYFTNDNDGLVFRDRFKVSLEDIDEEWFETIPEAVAWIKEQTGITIPDSISSNVNALYEYICNDLEEMLGMECNFSSVIV